VTVSARPPRVEPRIPFSGTRIPGKCVLGIETFTIRILSCPVAMAETKKTVVARLFAEHRGALQAFLYRRVRQRPVAAELAQEVYVRILRVPDIGAIRDLGAYLYTVASNLARDHARRERQDGTVLDVDDPLVQEELAELPGFAGQLDAEQRIKRLSEVLHQLPPKCHAAVVMQYWQGLSYEEIAGRLGVSTHMVKKYLSQAMVHCRRRMRRLG
jgi:RNA polymerase sigma factor (sigma-70 family)